MFEKIIQGVYLKIRNSDSLYPMVEERAQEYEYSERSGDSERGPADPTLGSTVSDARDTNLQLPSLMR